MQIYSEKYLYYSCLVIICCIIVTILYYFYIINLGRHKYDILINILNNISYNENNKFMNIGYWIKHNMTLLDANKELCNLVYKHILHKNKPILDIGCGYGEQDIFLHLNYDSKITALDLSQKQIDYATNKKDELNITKDKLSFLQGDATALPFQENSFYNIICIESAFHYKPRDNFIKECVRVMKPNSRLIIADIAMNQTNTNYNTIIKHFVKHLLHIPDDNFITNSQYVKMLEANQLNVNTIDITDKTFIPYINYFLKHNTLHFIHKPLLYFLQQINIENPFTYTIYICNNF